MKVVFASLFAVASAVDAEGVATMTAAEFETATATAKSQLAAAEVLNDKAGESCGVTTLASGFNCAVPLTEEQCKDSIKAAKGVAQRSYAHAETFAEAHADAKDDAAAQQQATVDYNAGVKLITDCQAAAVAICAAATDEASAQNAVDAHLKCDAPAMVFFTAAVAAVGAAFF